MFRWVLDLIKFPILYNLIDRWPWLSGDKGDRGRLQHFSRNWSYYLYYSRKATKVDFIWKGHLSAWFSSGFEVPRVCSFRAVNVLKQGVKCCNMPNITGSVATLPGDNCNTMSQNIHQGHPTRIPAKYLLLNQIIPGWLRPGGGGHSHMEVTGMCGHDSQSRGLSVTNSIEKKGGLSVRTKENRGSFGEDYKKNGVF